MPEPDMLLSINKIGCFEMIYESSIKYRASYDGVGQHRENKCSMSWAQAFVLKVGQRTQRHTIFTTWERSGKCEKEKETTGPIHIAVLK
jgi:hypothetical protein